MQERLAQLSRQVLQVQEDDRQRIGRELHDEIGQLLVATTANLEMIRNGLDGPREFVSERIDDADRLTKDLIGKVRLVIQDLLPDSLEQLGMIPTLRSYFRTFSERTNLPIHFIESPLLESFERHQKVAIYRVLQESLTNIAKHAGATNAVIETAVTDHAFLVQIHDNGRGFKVPGMNGAGPAEGSHLGILGMQERMKIAGGSLKIRSSPGKGTTVEMHFPLKQQTSVPVH
jgi:signal transduction histidine kinase